MDNKSRLLVFDNCEHVLDAAVGFDRNDHGALVDSSHVGYEPRGSGQLADEQLWPAPALDVIWTEPTLRRRRFCSSSASHAGALGNRIDHWLKRCEGGRDLPTPPCNPFGDRAGRVAACVDDRDRGAGPPLRCVPPARRVTACAGTPPDATATLCSGRTTCSSTPRRRFLPGARRSQADSTSVARAR